MLFLFYFTREALFCTTSSWWSQFHSKLATGAADSPIPPSHHLKNHQNKAGETRGALGSQVVQPKQPILQNTRWTLWGQRSCTKCFGTDPHIIQYRVIHLRYHAGKKPSRATPLACINIINPNITMRVVAQSQSTPMHGLHVSQSIRSAPARGAMGLKAIPNLVRFSDKPSPNPVKLSMVSWHVHSVPV